MGKTCHWRGRLQCFVRRGLGTASRLAFVCPRGFWEECTMMRRRPRFRLLLLLPRTLVLRAWWQGIRGGHTWCTLGCSRTHAHAAHQRAAARGTSYGGRRLQEPAPALDQTP